MLPVLDQASYAAKEITFKTPTKVNADGCLMFEALLHRVQTLILSHENEIRRQEMKQRLHFCPENKSLFVFLDRSRVYLMNNGCEVMVKAKMKVKRKTLRKRVSRIVKKVKRRFPKKSSRSASGKSKDSKVLKLIKLAKARKRKKKR